jgi:hypothetical protein
LATLFGFWMMVQLVSTLALILGGFYVLHCMGRYASSLDRLASAVEKLIHHQTTTPLGAPVAVPSTMPPLAAPVAAPFSSTPGAPAESPVDAPPFGASSGSGFPASDQPRESR